MLSQLSQQLFCLAQFLFNLLTLQVQHGFEFLGSQVCFIPASLVIRMWWLALLPDLFYLVLQVFNGVCPGMHFIFKLVLANRSSGMLEFSIGCRDYFGLRLTFFLRLTFYFRFSLRHRVSYNRFNGLPNDRWCIESLTNTLVAIPHLWIYQ